MALAYRSVLLGEHPFCIHGITTRDRALAFDGSVSLHTGETPEKIIANRERIAQTFGFTEAYHFVVADQTHSDNIVYIDEPKTKGWQGMGDAVANCDALITDQRGVALTVLTADCVPILLLDTQKEVIAAVHAGWRGTQADIAGKTVAKMMREFGSDADDIIAFIAPSIGRCCYEVGEDVAGHFDDSESYDRVGEKYMLDLPMLNQNQLMAMGIKKENIELSGVCTSCEVDRFFSYRKECGCSGRFMSMIALKREG